MQAVWTLNVQARPVSVDVSAWDHAEFPIMLQAVSVDDESRQDLRLCLSADDARRLAQTLLALLAS